MDVFGMEGAVMATTKKELDQLQGRPHFEIRVAGVQRDDPVNHVSRQVLIKKYVEVGTELELRREPENTFDPDAIAIWLHSKPSLLRKEKDYHLGYVPSENSKKVAKVLDEGRFLAAVVTAVVGGTKDAPSLGLRVAIAFTSPPPKKPAKRPSDGKPTSK